MQQTEVKGWETDAKNFFERWEDKELVKLVEETIANLKENRTHLNTAKNIVRFYNAKGYITAKQKWALSIFASQSK